MKAECCLSVNFDSLISILLVGSQPNLLFLKPQISFMVQKKKELRRQLRSYKYCLLFQLEKVDYFAKKKLLLS